MNIDSPAQLRNWSKKWQRVVAAAVVEVAAEAAAVAAVAKEEVVVAGRAVAEQEAEAEAVLAVVAGLAQQETPRVVGARTHLPRRRRSSRIEALN